MSSSEPSSARVLVLISDLMMQSQVASAVERAGLTLAIAASEVDCVTKAEAQQPELVIVDLTHPGLDVAALGQRLQEVLPSGSALLAFGPHVHKQRLAEAE